MTSKIGWIDFSPLHRERVKRFIELMEEDGVQDELGVGTIRDAMSNKLFPGFSTLHTRAKYFFITPYILLDRERKQRKSESGKDYFNRVEIETNNTIIKFYESCKERKEESYFGKFKKDGVLKRQPSEIYWNGITTLRLVNYDGTLDQLLRDKHSTIEELLSCNQGDDTVKEQGENNKPRVVDAGSADGWIENITEKGLTLTSVEAQILRDRLIKHTPNSLPTELLTNDEVWEVYKAAAYKDKGNEQITNAFINFVEKAYKLVENEELRTNLITAHDLSLFLYGPHIAYNLRLAEQVKAAESVIQELRDMGIVWLETLEQRMIDYKRFDISNCMQDVNVKPTTRLFLKEVQQLVTQQEKWQDIEPELCDRVEKQEERNKKTKSRFFKLKNNRVVDENEKGAWVGLGLINYRYTAALAVMKDVQEVLGK
ncbi:DUF6361 family protein [Prevotella sp. oral taxon 317]|uniref:DUF6361 family protein n=1 Tax=Prevotella sp. oral taxon 317 TaxID=652721 RepID=UPI0002FDADEB|nr:DUF6361 family protein [Prevotella sp. oral taxon 317]